MRLTEINLYHVILGTGKQVRRGLYNQMPVGVQGRRWRVFRGHCALRPAANEWHPVQLMSGTLHS